MSKLKSMRDFAKESLNTKELLNVNGGIGGPVDNLSTKTDWQNTLDSWNCTDRQARLWTDWNGGAWKTEGLKMLA